VNTVLLSLVTITKNDTAGLTRTLASAMAWRLLPRVEHIVVHAAEGILPAAEGNLIFRQERRTGIAGAFNDGIEAAAGEWIWFLNSGDGIDPRLVPEFLLTLLQSSSADAVIGGLVRDDTNALQPHFPLAKQWPPLAPWIPHPATIVRQSLFTDFGNYDDRYRIAMDYEWWLRAFRAETKVDILAVPFVRFAPGGVSQQPETRPLLAAERDDAIRRHQEILWTTWLRRGCALAKAWFTAQFAPRIGKSRAPR
jgi:glycosyltransferase involved in cell wall biosynthesis